MSREGDDESGFDDLLRRARAGDERALNDLFTQLRPYLKGAAQRRLPEAMKGRQDESDLVQEAMEEGFRDLAGFSGSGDRELLAWFKRVLEANSIDAVRAQMMAARRAVGSERSLDATGVGGGGLADVLAADATSPSQAVARGEIVARLLIAIEELPGAQRDALRLWQSGHSAREIGQKLGRTEGAAFSLVKHALKTLRAQFGDEGEEMMSPANRGRDPALDDDDE